MGHHSRQTNQKRQENLNKSKNQPKPRKSPTETAPPDIPGFVFDPQRRRYFSIPPSAGCQLQLLPGYLSSVSVSRNKYNAKDFHNSTNVCRSVLRRETNGPLSTCYSKAINEMELRSMVRGTPDSLSIRNDFTNCLNVIGGGIDDNKIIGVFSKGNINVLMTCAIRKNPCEIYDEKFKSAAFGHGTRYMFEVAMNVSNMNATIASCGMSVNSTEKVYTYSKFNFNEQEWNFNQPTFESSRESIFSIALDDATNLLATGTTGCVRIIQIDGQRNSLKVKSNLVNDERVHSMCFVDDGRGLIAGGHRGGLYFCDSRRPNNFCLNIDIGRRLLCDIKANDRTLFCSGYDNYLGAVDLRSRKQIVRYEEHVNLGRRIRVCINNMTSELMSCTGYDGRTRIWDATVGGQPIVTIDPPLGNIGNSQLYSVLMRPVASRYGEPVLAVFDVNKVFVYNAPV